nr:hypothetical protein [Candidatus Kapabacteria bacterium]
RRVGDYQVFEKDSDYVNNGFVLSDNWPSVELEHTLNEHGHDIIYSPPEDADSESKKISKWEVNGEMWYLTCNLGRYEDDDFVLDNEQVLTIKVKYVTLPVNGIRTTGYINFDRTPSTTIADTFGIIDTRNRYRGKALDLDSNTTDEFVITRNMLPINNNRDITISSSFSCKGNPTLNNYYLKKKDNADVEIDSLKIEVTYHGHSSLRVRWFRFETPKSRNLFFGKYDSLIQAHTQADLARFDCSDFKDRGIKIFRFFARDEFHVHHWNTARYYNRLLGGLTLTTHYKHYPKLFSYHVGDSHEYQWAFDLSHLTANPFIRKGSTTSHKYLDYKFGAWGLNVWDTTEKKFVFIDTLNSRYETHIDPRGDLTYSMRLLRDSTVDYYLKYLGYSNSLQADYELYLYDEYVRNTGEEYTGKNTIGYAFVGSNWGFDEATDSTPARVFSEYIRPKTGEEIRLMLQSMIIHGVKGYTMDRLSSDSLPPKPNDSDGNLMGIASRNFRGYGADTILASDAIGSDWMLSGDDTNIGFYVNRKDIGEHYLVDDTNKIYFGRRSTRLEIKRIHDWISRCEDELMKLRLVAWMGKGYRLWNNHHPDYPDSITFRRFLAWDEANNMIDTSRFKSWPIGRYDYSSSLITDPPSYPRMYENWDSTFIDFTLLKDKDTSINDLAYVGIQNRRTSPLLSERYVDSIYVGTDSARLATLYRISFYSTAEFEDSCDATKNPSTYQKFRDHWFSRAGC